MAPRPDGHTGSLLAAAFLIGDKTNTLDKLLNAFCTDFTSALLLEHFSRSALTNRFDFTAICRPNLC